MAERPIAIEALQIELRVAGVAQYSGIDVRPQHRTIGPNVVRDKLSKDGPAHGGFTRRLPSVFDIPTIAQPPGPARARILRPPRTAAVPETFARNHRR